MKKFILICLMLTSHLVHAVADRVNYSGRISVSPHAAADLQSVGVSELRKKPYMAFSAKFVLSSWTLMGTAVNSCSIIWNFADGGGYPSEEWIHIGGLPLRNAEDEFLYHVMSNHPDIQHFNFSNGIASFGIRKSALKGLPKLYDLDFLVPIEQLRNSEESHFAGIEAALHDYVNVRCVSGALGNAGQPGFDTPYALDEDKLLVLANTPLGYTISKEYSPYFVNDIKFGNFLPKEQALKTFDILVKEHKREKPYPVDSQKITIVNAEFDLHPVINFVSKVIREAKNAAHAEKMKRAAEQRREQLAKQTNEKSSSVDDTPTDQAYYQATSNKLDGLLNQLKKELVTSARESTVGGANTHHTDSQHYHQYFANRGINDDALALTYSRIEQTEQAFAQFANSYTSKAPRDMRTLYANVPEINVHELLSFDAKEVKWLFRHFNFYRNAFGLTTPYNDLSNGHENHIGIVNDRKLQQRGYQIYGFHFYATVSPLLSSGQCTLFDPAQKEIKLLENSQNVRNKFYVDSLFGNDFISDELIFVTDIVLKDIWTLKCDGFSKEIRAKEIFSSLISEMKKQCRDLKNIGMLKKMIQHKLDKRVLKSPNPAYEECEQIAR